MYHFLLQTLCICLIMSVYHFRISSWHYHPRALDPRAQDVEPDPLALDCPTRAQREVLITNTVYVTHTNLVICWTTKVYDNWNYRTISCIPDGFIWFLLVWAKLPTHPYLTIKWIGICTQWSPFDWNFRRFTSCYVLDKSRINSFSASNLDIKP